MSSAAIRLIATDFDGTLYHESGQPPVPPALEQLLAEQQALGVKWVINTGRDRLSLMQGLAHCRLGIQPDFLVLVEREIYSRSGEGYAGWEEWNVACQVAHGEAFVAVKRDWRRLASWVDSQFDALIYEDAYSPFCVSAANRAEADAIHDYLEEYCRESADLQVVRSDVYVRLAHAAYHKGRALAEIGRHLGVTAAEIFAAGDHYNDLPMLKAEIAGHLAAPANAIDPVKAVVRAHGGFVSDQPCGWGVMAGLRHALTRAAQAGR